MAHRKIKIYLTILFIYMGLIFYLSSYPIEMEVSSFSSFDKLLHMVVYGILSFLIFIALQEMNVTKRYLLALAFTISFLYGISNEIRQYFIPWRNADILDVMANGIGAFCFPMVLWLRNHYQNK